MNKNDWNSADPLQQRMARRHFLARNGLSIGSIALGTMLAKEAQAAPAAKGGVLDRMHYPVKAKRVIYLFMSGGPSQLDLFDYKPLLNKKNGEELPDAVRKVVG